MDSMKNIVRSEQVLPPTDGNGAVTPTTDEIRARRDRIERPPTLEQYAREFLKLPPEWDICRWTREGDENRGIGWGVTIEGGIAPPKTRGKYKGRPNWGSATMMRKLTVPNEQLDAWMAGWEADSGHCHVCWGIGWEWAGWNCETGTKWRSCRRCGGSGHAPEAPPPVPPVGEGLVPTEPNPPSNLSAAQHSTQGEG